MRARLLFPLTFFISLLVILTSLLLFRFSRNSEHPTSPPDQLRQIIVAPDAPTSEGPQSVPPPTLLAFSYEERCRVFVKSQLEQHGDQPWPSSSPDDAHRHLSQQADAIWTQRLVQSLRSFTKIRLQNETDTGHRFLNESARPSPGDLKSIVLPAIVGAILHEGSKVSAISVRSGAPAVTEAGKTHPGPIRLTNWRSVDVPIYDQDVLSFSLEPTLPSPRSVASERADGVEEGQGRASLKVDWLGSVELAHVTADSRELAERFARVARETPCVGLVEGDIAQELPDPLPLLPSKQEGAELERAQTPARLGRRSLIDWLLLWQKQRKEPPPSTEEGLIRDLPPPPVPSSHENGPSENRSVIPNDPQFHQQWHLTKIGAPAAWAYWTGPPGRGETKRGLIGVIDTGCDVSHPDLQKSFWKNPGELCFNGIDDDKNGFIDDCNGFDFNHWDGNLEDKRSHGTSVTGAVTADTNNDFGIAGTCWSCEVICCRVGVDSFSTAAFAHVR